MKVLITGATGFVGTRLVRKLAQANHEVLVLTRNVEKANTHFGVPVKAFAWNPTKELAPKEAVESADVIINLMGENISAGRWTTKQKEKIYNSRIVGTENLVKAINNRTEELDAFISTSAVGIYEKNKSEIIDESSKLADDFLAVVCRDWEAKANECTKAKRIFIPRVGVVFGEESGALAKLLPIFKLGGGGPIGLGKAMMSWIHVDDLVNIYAEGITNQKYTGVVNAVSPQPATNKDFTKALGQAVGMPAFFPVPPFMLQIIFGEMSSIILDSQHIVPKQLNEYEHKFEFSSIEEALNEICNKKKVDGINLIGTECFESYQFIPKKREEVFSFFSNPANLKKITPSELSFTMQKMSSAEIQKGTEIDYKFSKYGLPMKWKSLITQWDPQSQFADVQLKGPYSVWHHTHSFYEIESGTIIHDKVLFKLPLGPLGFLIAELLVKADIRKIFNFRSTVLDKVFQS